MTLKWDFGVKTLNFGILGMQTFDCYSRGRYVRLSWNRMAHVWNLSTSAWNNLETEIWNCIFTERKLNTWTKRWANFAEPAMYLRDLENETEHGMKWR